MTGVGVAATVVDLVDAYFSTHDARFRGWLSELTAAGSVSPDEEPSQRILAKLAGEAGLTSTWMPTTDALLDDPRFIPTGHSFEARPNVLVSLSGTAAPPIVLNAHIDVVDDGIGWTRDPRGAWEGDRFFARGSCDAKGSTIAALMAMACISDLAVRAAPMQLHSVVDEEPGGNGTLAIVRDLEHERPPQLAVIMEPSDLNLLIGHRGMLWYRIVCIGRQGHGSTGDGVNAIVDAALIVSALERAHHDFDAGQPLPPTINVGVIEGGTEAYTTAARCVIELTARYSPGERDFVDARVRTALAEAGAAGEVSVEFCRDFDAAASPASDPTVVATAETIRGRIPTAEISTLPATCDLRHYRNMLEVPSVIFGPGSLANAHGPDECVDWPEVVLAAKVLVDLAVRFADEPEEIVE